MSCLLEFGGSGGGGGTPGGANTNVQFNNSGSFGGDSGFTYIAGTGQAALNLGTITTNNKALTITGTLNNALQVFDAPLFMNITNTASAAGSLIADFQVGGGTAFNVGVGGTVTFSGGANLTTPSPGSTGGSYVWTFTNQNMEIAGTSGVGQLLFNQFGSISITTGNASLLFTNSSALANFGGSTLVAIDAAGQAGGRLYIDATGNLRMQPSAGKVQFANYNVVDNYESAPINYERGVFDWSTTSNVLTIGTQAGGTGTLRNMDLVSGATIVVSAPNIIFSTTGVSATSGVVDFFGDNGAGGGMVVTQNFRIGWAPFSSGLNGGQSPDTTIYRDAAVGIMGLANAASSTTATSFRVYNTTDNVGTNTAPTNYERGVLDWTTTTNVLTIGTQAGGTGTQRGIIMPYGAGGTGLMISQSGATPTFSVDKQANCVLVYTSFELGWGTSDASTAPAGGLSMDNGASGVMDFNQGTRGNHDGWFLWGGQTRVTSDFSVTSSTTLVNVTGLSVSLKAGRTYSFEAWLHCTDAAAGGVQASISGTATITNLIYDGYTVDANTIKGQTRASAFGTAVGSTTTTGTTPYIYIKGMITVNAAGTLTVQFAQNTSSVTASVVKQGSAFYVYDSP